MCAQHLPERRGPVEYRLAALAPLLGLGVAHLAVPQVDDVGRGARAVAVMGCSKQAKVSRSTAFRRSFLLLKCRYSALAVMPTRSASAFIVTFG